MTIRGRLMTLLLPVLIAFITILSLFFYFNWYHEIMTSFKSNLKSIVITTAQSVNADDISWIIKNRNNPQLSDSAIYKRYYDTFNKLKEKLPIHDLSIVTIEPVKRGDLVLPNQPPSDTNKPYDGHDPAYAFRQLNLLDADKKLYKGIEYDFSESNEQQVYLTKKAFVTPIYQGKNTQQEFITGYAPIVDANDQVIALVSADLNLDLLNKIIKKSIAVMLTTALVALFLVMVAVFLVANRLSAPVKKLKDAALTIAAGDYEEKIDVQGPQEITDLSNTLNTMRECLLENINRLRDGSAVRERLHGEYECSRLLQYYMIDGAIEEKEHPQFNFKHISLTNSSTPHGVMLHIDGEIKLSEAQEPGFESMYKLLKDSEGQHLQFKIVDQKIQMDSDNLPTPLVWSSKQAKFVNDQVEPGDYVFLYNSGLAKLMPHSQQIREWFGKVLRHFSKEGLELLSAMISSEVNFLARKQPVNNDIHIIVMQIK